MEKITLGPERKTASASSASPKVDPSISPGSKSYVGKPDFNEAAKASGKRWIPVLVISAMVSLALFSGWAYKNHDVSRIPAQQDSQSNAAGTKALTLDIARENEWIRALEAGRVPEELKNLPESARKEILSRERRAFTLMVTTAGAKGDVISLAADGVEYGALDMSVLGSQASVALKPNEPALMRQLVISSAGRGAYFSVGTDDGKVISRPLKVGEQITWTLVPR